jgi:hypothetical protein
MGPDGWEPVRDTTGAHAHCRALERRHIYGTEIAGEEMSYISGPIRCPPDLGERSQAPDHRSEFARVQRRFY